MNLVKRYYTIRQNLCDPLIFKLIISNIDNRVTNHFCQIKNPSSAFFTNWSNLNVVNMVYKTNIVNGVMVTVDELYIVRMK